MILGIDPKVDFAFKFVFGRDATRMLLIDMLNKVLRLTGQDKITEIELLNPFSIKDAADDKLAILDIKARDQAGRRFNIEMQMLGRSSYLQRVLYYWSGIYR